MPFSGVQASVQIDSYTYNKIKTSRLLMSNSMQMLYKQLLLRTVFFRKRLDKFTRCTVFSSYSRFGWLEAEM